MPAPRFNGLRVLVLESRRGREMGSIVTSYGGDPLVAPSMREIPLESNVDALAFADALMAGRVDLMVFLTGVGARAVIDLVDRARGERARVLEALRAIPVVCRGPKPLAVMREMQVPVWLTAPEPNTWRELLAVLDANIDERTVRGLRLGVQEYGAANPELLAGLQARGAVVTRVPIYQWALPEDIGPLRAAIAAIVAGTLEVALFTTATQLVHLLRVAGEMGQEEAVRAGLARLAIASIGPTTSEELTRQRVPVDIEASHPKMGFLVREAAEHAHAALERKSRTD